ncbi:hypothetical protein PGIGA_G00105140 [Pangasianodon gigas]|uniref:Uncharacterized protein n=1 Tax=Pangasianodon gigas TaxID=30993 RepID=A0ACC5W7N0_PANGG|nr:hypothetical protein [Pangasianodon gigas]
MAEPFDEGLLLWKQGHGRVPVCEWEAELEKCNKITEKRSVTLAPKPGSEEEPPLWRPRINVLAEIIKSLASLHQTKHQALLELWTEQEQRFQALLQAQAEDQQVLRSLVHPAGTPAAAAAAAMPHIMLFKTGPHDDLEAFLKLFERAVEAWGWPDSQYCYCRGKSSSRPNSFQW